MRETEMPVKPTVCNLNPPLNLELEPGGTRHQKG